MRATQYLLPLFIAVASLTACAAAPSEPTSAPAQAEVTRDAAITTARHDAAARFAGLSVADVSVQRMGTFWVVELRTANGSGLRYAISRHDGSIRQRNSFQ